jgi:hypothetical protein
LPGTKDLKNDHTRLNHCINNCTAPNGDRLEWAEKYGEFSLTYPQEIDPAQMFEAA